MADINQGLFLPIVPLFDVGDLQDETQSRELIIRLTQTINDVIRNLNLKDTGIYDQNEYFNGQTWFPNINLLESPERQVVRLVVNTGMLPNTGVLSVPHGIAPTNLYTFTRIYGAASDTTDLRYIPLPFTSTILADNIQLDVDAVNVNITTAINYNAFNFSYVVLEFLTN